MALNLSTHSKQLKKAYNDILNRNSNNNWVLFGYDGSSFDLKVCETGEDGLEELAEEFNGGRVQFAFARVIDTNTQLPKFVLINWSGEGVQASVKAKAANHVRSIAGFLKGAHVTINARSEDDVDPESIMKLVAKSSGANFSYHKEKPVISAKPEKVGSVYKKIEAKHAIDTGKRANFWETVNQDQAASKIEDSQKLQDRLQLEDRQRRDREKREQDVRDKKLAEHLSRVKVQRESEDAKRQSDIALMSDRLSQEKERAISSRNQEGLRQGESLTQQNDEIKKNSDFQEQLRLKSQQETDERAGKQQLARSAEQERLKEQQAAEEEGHLKAERLRQEREFEAQEQLKKEQDEREKLRQHEFEAQDRLRHEREAEAQEELRRQQECEAQDRIRHEQELEAQEQLRRQQECEAQDRLRHEQELEAQEELRRQQECEAQDRLRHERELEAQEELRRQQECEAQDRLRHEQELEAQEELRRQQECEAQERLNQQAAVEGHTSASDQSNVESGGMKAVVLYDYEATDEDELNLITADTIHGIEQIDEGWWTGYNSAGNFGMFPANYVDLV